MLLILFLLFIFLLIVFYFLFKKDILQPGIIFISCYIISVFFALINTKKWEIEFHINTFLVLLIGAIEFLFISYLIYRHFNKDDKTLELKKISLNRKKRIKTVKNDGIYDVKLWVLLVISIYCILVIALLFYYVLKIASSYGTYNSLSNALTLFKQHTSYSLDSSIPRFVQWLQKPVYAFAYIFLFYYLKNIIYGNNKMIFLKKSYYLVPVISFIIQEFLSSNRLSILSIFIASLVMLGLLWYERNEYKSTIKLKTILLISLIGIGVLFLFYFSASAIGRKNNKNIVDYISIYTGGSIECFNRFLQEDHTKKTGLVGEESFYYLIKNLYDYNIIKMENFYPIHLEFRDLNDGSTIGNVYTAYRRWIHDFNYLGAFILNGLMAIFYSLFYNYIKKIKNNNIKEFSMIIYAYMSYPLFLHCIDGYLYLLTVRLAFITTFLIFIMCFIFIKNNNVCILLEKIGKKA